VIGVHHGAGAYTASAQASWNPARIRTGHLSVHVAAETISAYLDERVRRRGRIHDPVNRPVFDDHRGRFGLPDCHVTLLTLTWPPRCRGLSMMTASPVGEYTAPPQRCRASMP
jgi:hypothetical protein